MQNPQISKIKDKFGSDLKLFTETLKQYVSSENGEWTVKGFIDVYKNIYTISGDTKIVSKILEIHLFPLLLKFAEEHGYKIVLAEMQNWYPDISFVSTADDDVIFAVDLKTTYLDPNFPGHVNGFTLGSHGTYFKDRDSTKNIQFPYSKYLGHFCLGIIYSRTDFSESLETEITQVHELKSEITPPEVFIGERRVTKVDRLQSITSVIRDFDFFVAEKWQIAGEKSGSGNTANIGSITNIEDLVKGNGTFAELGEEWFDEYWINFGEITRVVDGKTVPITNLIDFLEFKGRADLKDQIVTKVTKRKVRYPSQKEGKPGNRKGSKE